MSDLFPRSERQVARIEHIPFGTWCSAR